MCSPIYHTKQCFIKILIFLVFGGFICKFNFYMINMADEFSLSIEEDSNQTCILPSMPKIKRRKLSERFKLTCSQHSKNIVSVSHGKFKIISTNNKSPPHCVYRVIKRIDDDRTILHKKSVPFKTGDPIPNDYFHVFCYANSSSNRILFKMKVVAVKALHKLAAKRSETPPKSNSLPYNVAMLGFDSLSRVSFMENLPNVYDIFTREMNGVVFKKHTVVGDGSTPNLVAVTTGLSLKYLKQTYKTVDDYPLIYKYLQKNGYMTLFFEDTSKYWGVYTKSQSGFKKTPPIDHYLRPFYVDKYVGFECLGSLPSYKMYMNLLHEMYNVYNNTIKKFPFIFQVQCSHNRNKDVQALEDDLVEILQQFRAEGKFDNTILFLFSDHGIRFSKRRVTLAGKFEERLPFLGIYLPESLQKQRPELLQTLRRNSKHLTSQFDLYATLLHILGEKLPDTNQSLSLLSPLPGRTCEEAGIESHWCMCHSRTILPNTNKLALLAAQATIIEINRATKELRHLCSELKLRTLQSAERLHLNHKIVTHRATTKPTEMFLMVAIAVSPGDGLFESTVRYDIQRKTFDVKQTQISRINRYASWIKCLPNQYVIMRKFCICKDALLY